MKKTPASVVPARLIDPRAPEEREKAICAAVADLITREDVAEALAALRRGLKAQTTIRAPKKPGAETQNNYMLIDDVPAQLAAVKLMLAYKFGNPASVVEMQLTEKCGDADQRTLSRDEMIDRLRASGTNLNAIVSTWLGAARKVEAEAGPLPPDLEKTAKAVESLVIIDV